MKDQYFGDVNDYRKYGLMRALTANDRLSIAVCWMLTPDSSPGNGQFRLYLQQPERFRPCDPELFDMLSDWVASRGVRNVSVAKDAGVIPGAHYYSEPLPDDATDRDGYFRSFWSVADGCSLVFFDPDNGIEVESKPYGRKGSSKYLYWREVEEGWRRGHSLLVYQHFPRKPRNDYINERASQLLQRTGAATVYSFRTPYVVLFLLPALTQPDRFERGIEQVRRAWNNQICAQLHSSPEAHNDLERSQPAR